MMLLSPEDVIKRMVQVYRAHWASMLRYVGLMFAVGAVFILVLVIGVVAIIGISFASADPQNIKNMLAAVSGSFVVFIVLLVLAMIILNTWIEAAFIKTTSRAVMDHQKVSLGTELKESKSFIWRILGAAILSTLIMIFPFIIGLLLWIVLRQSHYFGVSSSGVNMLNGVLILIGIYSLAHAIYFSVRLGFARVGIVLDNWGVTESLKKSSAWVKGKWWAILGRLFCAVLVLIIPYYIFSGLAGGIDGFIGIFFSLVTAIYYIGFLMPMAMIPSLILYHNLKGDLPEHAPHKK